MAAGDVNQVTIGKNHEAFGLRYDTLETLHTFSTTVTASLTTASVVDRWPVATACKIMGVSVNTTAASPDAISAFNICMGTGAESGEGQPDNSQSGTVPPTVAAAGNCVFSSAGAPADVAVTMAADTPQYFGVPPPGFEVIWPQNALLTLRVASGSGGTGAIQVTVLGKYYDIIPWRPSSIPNAAGGVTFDPRYDIA